MTCTCEVVSPVAHQCPEHFHLWRNGKRLTSVGRIVGVFPGEPCSSCHWLMFSEHQSGCPVKVNVENAKERGSEVDGLFGRYVTGKLSSIPAGTRNDSRDLLLKLIRWFDAQRFIEVESQVLLADDEVGGLADLRCDGMILDLKCTYDVSSTHELQIGGYCSLDATTRKAAVLHVTERYAQPRLIPLDVADIVADFAVCREMYGLAQRRRSKG